MNILIIGSGAREHAILTQVHKSQGVEKIYVAPGNVGMADVAECVAIPPENTELLVEFARKNKIDLTIVGPELPLTLGIVDAFQAEGLKIFGPSKRASQLEGSKIFTKEFCARHNIPTAPFQSFEEATEARAYLRARNTYPIVIKADGLAAGKGVVVAKNFAEADKAITEMMLYEKFGPAGRKVLIEDFLSGEEVSFIVMTDGKYIVEFPAAQDHKRVFDNDEGPNTGGMGAYAPAPVVTAAVRQKIITCVILPTLAGMAAEERPYVGFLFAGFMISKTGDPFVIEFNCRLGDPETEVILPLLKSDFVVLIEMALSGNLDAAQAQFENKSCVGIVLASGGYPDGYEKGFAISGLENINATDVTVFHAGTKKKDGRIVNEGGRVLVVSAIAADLKSAIVIAYENVKKISWKKMHYRKDIGAKAL